MNIQKSFLLFIVLFLVACSGANRPPPPPQQTAVPDTTSANVDTVEPTAVIESVTGADTKTTETTDSAEMAETAVSDDSTAEDHSHTHASACHVFLDNTVTHCDEETAFVESNGLPTTHNMMVGIISWQQQFPLPQGYTGDNAWQIPLNPELADEPISGASDLFRGAIALAVNGVPIFNALNNRGDDAYLAGELDEWGGHAGRGDDYHYHIAPTHLQEIVGIDQPIAYALDGFPIYGLTEPDGTAVTDLDEYNGHFDEDGNYHYHATETYPYINGGMRGVVGYDGGQVEPQPRIEPVRPAGEPLRGAEITAFTQTGTNEFSLQYTLSDQTYTVNYMVENGTYAFEFIDASGNRITETYTP